MPARSLQARGPAPARPTPEQRALCGQPPLETGSIAENACLALTPSLPGGSPGTQDSSLAPLGTMTKNGPGAAAEAQWAGRSLSTAPLCLPPGCIRPHFSLCSAGWLPSGAFHGRWPGSTSCQSCAWSLPAREATLWPQSLLSLTEPEPFKCSGAITLPSRRASLKALLCTDALRIKKNKANTSALTGSAPQ